jgi:hypothetical protein
MITNMEKTWFKPVPAALPITRQELIEMGISEEQIESGEARGELKTSGPWQIPVSYKALCTSSKWDAEKTADYRRGSVLSVTFYGMRTMNKIRQSGYEIEGYVSVNGKKCSCFSSSQLFELENGKLIDVAVIHARMRNG